MASRRSQIITVAVIWVAVCGLGWHAYKNVLPKYGFFAQPGRGNRGANREAWQEAQTEQDAFYKEEKVPSKIWIKVSEADEDDRVRMSGGLQRQRSGVFYYARGASMSEAYATLSGTPRWRVSQLPREAQRWNIRIKAPESQREQVAKAFLDYMRWDVKKRKTQTDGFTFVAGPPPAPPPPPPNAQGGRRGGGFPRMQLGRMAGMLSGRANAQVRVDAAVREKEPPGEGRIDLPWNLRGEELINRVAAIYGVAVSKKPTDLETYLIYHPKYTSSFDVGRWEREGGQDEE